MTTIDPAYHTLLTLLAQSDDSSRVFALLDALLTDKEQHELANRMKILSLIYQGLPQREIAETLGVGVATVSRGVKAYHKHNVAQLIPQLAHIATQWQH